MGSSMLSLATRQIDGIRLALVSWRLDLGKRLVQHLDESGAVIAVPSAASRSVILRPMPVFAPGHERRLAAVGGSAD